MNFLHTGKQNGNVTIFMKHGFAIHITTERVDSMDQKKTEKIKGQNVKRIDAIIYTKASLSQITFCK